MGKKDDVKASQDGYLLYYHRPVQSRNKKLWLCYILNEQQWALSSTPYFPKTVDIGFRWLSRTEGVITLNMVSSYPYGSTEMKDAIIKCRHTMETDTLQV